MISNFAYDVTVILASYNPDFSKMRKTIKSVVNQTGVRVQLVICDDGSADNKFLEVEEYLRDLGFTDYKLVPSPINNGTVMNFYNGLQVADGEFIKGISPGDYLYEDDELDKWIQFMRTNKLRLSFGHAIFYHYENDVPKPIVRYRDAPAIPAIYNVENESSLLKHLQKIDWIICRDSILGCLILAKKELCIQYIPEILYKLKYAEDYMFRLMLLDEIKMGHYNAPVLYYEYGDGVSNSSREKWMKYLYNDEVAFSNILNSKKQDNKFVKQYCVLLKMGGLNFFGTRRQIMSVLLFPLSFLWKIYKVAYRRMGYSRPFQEKNEVISYIEHL